MFRLIRPLLITERKCFLQSLKISSPMSQSPVYDIFKEQEKKEPNTESKNVENDTPVNIKVASLIGETNTSNKAYETGVPNTGDESIEKIINFPRGTLNFGGTFKQNSFIRSKEHLSSSSPERLIQFLKHLSSTKQRPYSLIKCAVDRLTCVNSDISLLDCSTLLYSLSSLSYRDEAILDKISEIIKAKKSEFIEGLLPVSMLQSFGMLKYRNCEVIDTLLQCVLKHKDSRTPNEKLTALMTLATVNYLSPLGSALLQEMLQFTECDFNSTKSYLNFVWACTILNHLSQEHISTVLSDEFVHRLLLSAGSSGYDICSLKLLNINAAAVTLLKNYTKPLLSKKISKSLHQSKSKMEFTRFVVDGLCHLYLKDADIRVNIDTGAGFILDVEISNKNYSKKLNYIINDKIGIILLGYNDICCNEEKTVDGFNNFKQRILKAKSYKTLYIPFSEYNENMKMSEKIEYLRNKLKNLDDV